MTKDNDTMINSVQIRALQPADIRVTVDLLADAFCERDPIEAALGITTDDFRSMAQHEVSHALTDGLSVVAVAADTGNILGTMIAGDACTTSPAGDYAAQHKFRPVAALINSLTSAYLSKQAFSHGDSIYLFMLAVGPSNEGRGLGRALLVESLAQAQAKGYRSAFAAVTNLASHHVLARQGFADLASTRYEDFDYEGEAVFASIRRHPCVTLVEKQL